MIKLISENKLLLDTLKIYFSEIISPNIIKNNYEIIKIDTENQFITLKFKEKKIILPSPIEISSLRNEINKILLGYVIKLNNLSFYPYQRAIEKNDNKIFLTDIQNIIFSNLINDNKGIDKKFLYQEIWKNDKEIFINKLDTHLTNLKNFLNNALKVKINFLTKNKKIQLLVD